MMSWMIALRSSVDLPVPVFPTVYKCWRRSTREGRMRCFRRPTTRACRGRHQRPLHPLARRFQLVLVDGSCSQASLDSAAFTDSSHASQGACSKNGDGGKRYRLTSRRVIERLAGSPTPTDHRPRGFQVFIIARSDWACTQAGRMKECSLHDGRIVPQRVRQLRCASMDSSVGKEAGERPGRSARGAMARYHFV
jgi:hypothetical protein